MPTGYSGTPLIKKLGITVNTRLLPVDAPDNYMELLEQDLSQQVCTHQQSPDLIHIFAKRRKDFESHFKKLAPLAKQQPAMVIWVSWYKQSSGIGTDLTENDIRNFALQEGWVDIKVCAVSELWSGLKLVVPKAKRGKL